ncbi:hypothetical protein Glove_168g195 [Diversispora epigaea]|uniref:Uncharacterized protein n=1 Tax=Diversispora epigaea TaxID=1348612 RepID=A0A397IPS0_9GLOM|nr:hypothetical protein Glove_168g195 [Diversispora epigaea]
MIFSIASPVNAGFSYLLLFKEEYYSDIAQLLKEGPTVYNVVDFVIQNDHSCLIKEKIKPTINHETNSVLIENVGNEPSSPIKRGSSGWDDEPEETDEEFQIRKQQYEAEKQRWFFVKEFLYFVGQNHRNYKFE